MRNPFKSARNKIDETKKELQDKAIEAGVQGAVNATKDKIQDHFKENWKTYAVQSATAIGSGIIAGVVGGSVKRQRPITQVVEKNTITYNIVINKY